MTILLSDPRVSAVPVHDCDQPMVRLERALSPTLGGAGLVNYPTEWWHWSFGDRYWALITGADRALYGPVRIAEAA